MIDSISRQAAIDLVIQYCPDDDGVCSKADEDIRNSLDELEDLPPAQSEQQHGRIFQEIVVEYPSYCIYPEYKGKPYFSIKYAENGQEFTGYGTYKPEVLSEYLKEYFMSSAQSERKTGHWINAYPDIESNPMFMYGICSECGFEQSISDKLNYCPNCGSYNRGKQE